MLSHKGISYFQQHLYCAPESYVLTDSQSFLWLQFGTVGVYDRPHTRSQGNVLDDPVLNPDLFPGHWNDNDDSEDDDDGDDNNPSSSRPLSAMDRSRNSNDERTVSFNI